MRVTKRTSLGILILIESNTSEQYYNKLRENIYNNAVIKLRFFISAFTFPLI